MRIAFVIVPNFVYQVHASKEGPLFGCSDEQRSRAVVVEGEGGRARVVAAAKSVQEEGVSNGMTLARARSKAGYVWSVVYEDALVVRKASELSGALLSASPQVHISGSGVFWVGAGGFRLLGGEQALIALIDELICTFGYEPPRVGVADSVIAARAAAIHGLGVVSEGGDKEALATLPLSVLPLDESARSSLWALGIRSVGAFSVLPASQIVSRFGEVAEKAHRLALGDDPRMVPLLERTESPTIEVDFETPFDVVEPALFVLQGGMNTLVAPHRLRGFGIQRLKLELKLRDGEWTREVRPPEPVTSTQRLIEMCKALLQDVELPSMMEGVRVSILEVAPAAARQEGLWDGGRRRRPVAIDVTLMRLQSRLGTQAVKTPGLSSDAHLPDYMARWDDIDPHVGLGYDSSNGNCSAAWRLKRPAQEVSVAVRKGSPTRVMVGKYWSVLNEVAGPHRIESHWWEPTHSPEESTPFSGIRRDYWYVQVQQGPALSLYCDLETNDWFLQGVLD